MPIVGFFLFVIAVILFSAPILVPLLLILLILYLKNYDDIHNPKPPFFRFSQDQPVIYNYGLYLIYEEDVIGEQIRLQSMNMEIDWDIDLIPYEAVDEIIIDGKKITRWDELPGDFNPAIYIVKGGY